MTNGPPVQVCATSVGSELSRQIPVDLEADADLNEGWGCPGHWSSSFSRVTQGRSWRAATQGPHHTRGCADAAYSAGQFYCSRPVGLPVACRAAYHCRGKAIRCPAISLTIAPQGGSFCPIEGSSYGSWYSGKGGD